MGAEVVVVNSPDTSCGDDIPSSPGTVLSDGILPVDKPVGLTSHDVVDVVRRCYRIRRVGHTGTLDPAASGLMLLLLGRATKVAPYLTSAGKTYRADIRFGMVSDTGDAQGELRECGDTGGLTEEMIRKALPQVTGRIVQRVPALAAVRSGGQRRYKLARAGRPVPPLEREVTVHESELLSFASPVAVVRFHCGSGTYVRSLAEKLGEIIGCGAYLSGLRREAVGRWRVEDAVELATLQDRQIRKAAMPPLLPIEDFLDYPRIEVTPEYAAVIAQGRPILGAGIVRLHGEAHPGQTVLLTDGDGHVLAIGGALCDFAMSPHEHADTRFFEYKRVLV